MQKVADKAVGMQACTGYNITWTAVAERTSKQLVLCHLLAELP